MEPTSDVYVLDQNPGIGRRNRVCPSHLSCISPLLQPKLSSVNTKKCLYEIGKWPHCRDAAHPNSSCCTGPVWGQSWKIKCQIRFIQWVGLLINFSLLVQVQRRWDRADSQKGRLREQAAVVEWWPVLSLASFLCRLLKRRLWALESVFWEPTAPVAVWTGSALPHAGKDQSYRAGVLLSSLRNMEPASREDRRLPVQE